MAIKLRNVYISGAHTGIKSTGPIDIDAQNVTFDNVKVPYDIAGARSASVRGSRITNDPKLSQAKSTSGWTKPNGPPLPVFCPSCKSIFASRNYNFGGAYFNAWDNEETCPECGNEHAKLSEGLFNLATDAVRVLSAPDITYAMLQAISRIGEAVAEGKMSADDAIKRFERISPRLGRIAKRAWQVGSAAVFLIAAIAGIYAGCYVPEQVRIGREQVRLAEEQLKLQQEANRSSDAALDKMLGAISGLRFKSEGIYEDQSAQSAQEPRAGPAENKTRGKAGLVELRHKRKPKRSRSMKKRGQSGHGGEISN